MSEIKKTTEYMDFESFFTTNLKDADPDLYDSLLSEFKRQQLHIELIASENIVSRSVLDAQGSIMTNKYAEGYSGRRYYGGCEHVDIAEDLAISRACELFNAKFANVQMMAVDKNGVSYDLISQVLINVETEVNDILAQIVDFQIIFEMDGKNINNYIAYDDDKSWSLEMASGMEKFISTLAIRIALTNISNLPRPNFIAIDEGWGTMDSDNLNSLYQLFQYLKNIFQFSLIISHIDTMRDFTDILLEIKQEEGLSKIVF